MASSYKADFADALVTLYRLIQSRRSWASDVWTDTVAGTGKEIKACLLYTSDAADDHRLV